MAVSHERAYAASRAVLLQMMSNISKLLHDTALAITRRIGG
jgi:hypothetical protein